MSIDLDIYAFGVLIGNCDLSNLTIEPFFVDVKTDNDDDEIKLTIDGSLIKINENYSFQYKINDWEKGDRGEMINQEKPDCDQNIMRYSMRL